MKILIFSHLVKLSHLSLISSAALLVNVIANMLDGSTLCLLIKVAIREAITFVLPDPGPAIIIAGPSLILIAFN